MKFYRIYAVILRYVYLFKHSYDRLSDVFYWPIIDLFIWGLTMSYIKLTTPNSELVVTTIITGVLLWIIVWRAQYEITVGLLEDLWSRNLVNMFVAPLKFSEWIASLVILGAIKAFISFSFASLLAYHFFQINILQYGLTLFPAILLLLITGWAVGFFVAGIILRFGTKVQTLAWTTIFLLAPFSAVYYPLSVLPQWAQQVAAYIPTSYVFESIRHVLTEGEIDAYSLLISLFLNIIYLLLAFIFLKKSFNKVLKTGLAKVS